jgi:hypothetical protein
VSSRFSCGPTISPYREHICQTREW